MKDTDRKQGSGIGVKSLIAGTVIGGTLGVLFAPKKGSDTREDIKKKIDEKVDEAGETAADLKDQVSDKVEEVKENIGEKVNELRDRGEDVAEDLKNTKVKDVANKVKAKSQNK